MSAQYSVNSILPFLDNCFKTSWGEGRASRINYWNWPTDSQYRKLMRRFTPDPMEGYFYSTHTHTHTHTHTYNIYWDFPGDAVGLRICLPMQGTRVWALVREDPTCRRATKPVHHNYWACALEPASHGYWAHVPQLLNPGRLESMLRNKRSHWNEKPTHRNEE